MFTGIVQGCASVAALEQRDHFMQLTLQLPANLSSGLAKGASIAVNGTCLTITQFTGNQVSFDVIGETLRLTNLARLRIADQVNVERAARFGDEIGGHLLSGHICTQAIITQIIKQPDNCEIRYQVDPAFMLYILPKGYVALNGCSLTVGSVQTAGFNTFLIPETLAVTTFGRAQCGDAINLEVDPQTQAIVDTVNRQLNQLNPAKLT